MNLLPPSLQTLISELSKLPSIGEKSAMRLANFLISNPDTATGIAKGLTESLLKVGLCRECFFFSEEEKCRFCTSSRSRSTLCVVEKPMDVLAIERSGEFSGLYHVLHGVWSPIKGTDAAGLKLAELKHRVQEDEISEIIVATSATVEGDATALYIGRLLKDLEVSISRLAQGVPKGGELEYLDSVTLSRAFQGRNVL